MTGRHWTEEEKTIIRQWWPTTNPIRTWMHLIPGKSRPSILGMGKRMGLGIRPMLRKPTNAQSWLCILQLLADGRLRSVNEIAERTGFSDKVIRKQLRDHIGQEVYVAEWRFEINRHTALFAVGSNRRNAPKPKAKTKAQIQRNYMVRVKNFEPAKHEARLSRERARKHARKEMPRATDPAASWMFNPC